MARPNFKKIREEHTDKLSKFDGGSWAATVWFPVPGNIIFNLDEYSVVEMLTCEKGAPCYQLDIDGYTYAPHPYKYEIFLNASREALRRIQNLRENPDGKAHDEFGGMDHLISQHAHFYALFVSYVSDPELKEEKDMLPDFD